MNGFKYRSTFGSTGKSAMLILIMSNPMHVLCMRLIEYWDFWISLAKVGGVFFGCKRPCSVKGYVLSALAIIGILFGLHILCYIIYRCFKREMQHPHSARETVSVLREIDEKMEEIRNTWSHEEFKELVGRDMYGFFKDYDEWTNYFDFF
ncbi:hypothetical protein GBA52_009754 [Prunus armeniaca]|nr:hypothetical protein GBA52_009754 [Prunus armeniaca]